MNPLEVVCDLCGKPPPARGYSDILLTETMVDTGEQRFFCRDCFLIFNSQEELSRRAKNLNFRLPKEVVQ